MEPGGERPGSAGAAAEPAGGLHPVDALKSPGSKTSPTTIIAVFVTSGNPSTTVGIYFSYPRRPT